MNKNTLIVAIFSLILIIIVGGAYIFFLAQDKVTDTVPDSTTALFPFSDQKKNTVASDFKKENQDVEKIPQGTIVIRTHNGSLNVRDFTKDTDVGVTVEGDAFYITSPSNSTLSERELEYEISYIPSEKRIIAAIFKEPVGETRSKISTELSQRLSVTAEELCSLDILVITPRWVNDFYADKNLGLPGCPGAVKFSGD